MTRPTLTTIDPIAAAQVRLDSRTDPLAATLRADYEDALATGETNDVEDYLRWIRKVLTGSLDPQ